MQTFKDSEGIEWTIKINVASVKRVRDLAGVDLMGALDGSLFERLALDPILLGDVLHALCRPQAEERNLTPEQFGERLASGEVIEEASVALVNELIPFFRPGQREALTKIAQITKEIQDLQVTEAMETLNDPETIETAKRMIQKQKAEAKRELQELGDLSGATQDS